MPRRGENIYKRKDGRWEGRYIKEYDSCNQAKYVSVYARTYIEVKQKLLQAKNSLSTEKQHNMYTFNYYAEKWLRDKKSQVKHSTYVKYTNTVNNHLLPFLGNKKITEITTDILKNYIVLKLQNGNLTKKTGLSTKTVKDMISIIKLIIEYAERFNEKANCDFKILTYKSNTISQNNSISEKTQKKLTTFLMEKTDYTKLGILLCLYTGIRIGELCAIQYEDICVDEKTIKITKTMQRLQNFSEDSKKKTSITITPPKSPSSQREIPIPDFLMDIILGFEFSDKSYILTGRSDKYIEPRTLEYRFKSCLKKCGLVDCKFHQLRHRFATQCIELGFDIKSLSEIMGHSNVNITLNRYVHASMDLKRKNMNKLQCIVDY